MKGILLAVGLLFGILQSTAGVSAPIKFSIEGQFTQLHVDSIALFEYRFGEYQPLYTTAFQKSGNNVGAFTINGTVPEKGIYWLGYKSNPAENGILLLIGDETKIYVSANARVLFDSAVLKSTPLNQAYLNFLRKYRELQDLINEKMQELNYLRNSDAAAAGVAVKSLDSLTTLQIKLVSGLEKDKGVLGKIVKLYQWVPYHMSNKSQQYPSDQEYTKHEYLSNVDFSDPQISYIPFFFDKISNYTSYLITQLNLPYLEAIPLLDKIHKQIPPKSRAEETFLQAVMKVIVGSKYNPDFIDMYLHFSELFVTSFPQRPGNEQRLQEIAQYGKVRIGQVPPDIAMMTPEGTMKKLSELRGKVVLLDFWASWCGPCRKENPHVVNTYGKYKDKGFDVFSVSLDSQKPNWIGAIAQDNLTWKNHVSDLKGWQSAAAQVYGVSSIPATFLLDKEGRVIAKNLRGAQLEQKLEKIFGH